MGWPGLISRMLTGPTQSRYRTDNAQGTPGKSALIATCRILSSKASLTRTARGTNSDSRRVPPSLAGAGSKIVHRPWLLTRIRHDVEVLRCVCTRRPGSSSTHWGCAGPGAPPELTSTCTLSSVAVFSAAAATGVDPEPAARSGSPATAHVLVLCHRPPLNDQVAPQIIVVNLCSCSSTGPSHTSLLSKWSYFCPLLSRVSPKPAGCVRRPIATAPGSRAPLLESGCTPVVLATFQHRLDAHGLR